MESIKEKAIEMLKEYKLACGILAAGALIGGGFWLTRPAPAPAEEIPTTALLASSSLEEAVQPLATSSETSLLTVDVKGAVRTPGVYELEEGSRVRDAIEAAGGLTDDAASKSINLAQKVTDEAVIYVAKEGEEGADVTGSQTASTSSTSASSQSGLVNLNTATLSELQTVSGIGAKRAQDILDYREANGKFQSVDDLKNVSGIGDKTLEKLRAFFTV